MRKHAAPGDRKLALGLVILHEDRDILVVNKPAGLLTIATENDKTRTAYFILTDYVRKGEARSRNRVFIVHRLDRETSGVLVFAKTEQAKARLQGDWDNTRKTYLAVVHGRVEKNSGTIDACLAENSAHVVYQTADPAKGKPASTAYRVLQRAEEFTLLELDLQTGRKHQIRVHMAGIGHPIVGDKKYGRDWDKGKGGRAGGDASGGGGGSDAKGNSRRHARPERMALHAWRLAFNHPTSGERMTFTAKAPESFNRRFPAQSRPERKEVKETTA
jgi:tRNA pseudouridine32 synthase/23S rRNA pseudouridine746 synthase/23S rRNA pseudouridine1911/1915/1917 synthase